MEIMTKYNNQLIFTAVILMAIMFNFDGTAMNLALASIGKTFHAPLVILQWIISVYFLFGAALQVFSGRLADIFGRKCIYLFGIVLFILASIIVRFLLIP